MWTLSPVSGEWSHLLIALSLVERGWEIKLLSDCISFRLLNMKKRRKRHEHLNLDIYWTGRPWYASPGVPIKDSKGTLREIADLSKLVEGIRNVLVNLGADEVSFSNPRVMYDSYKECDRCGKGFERERISARFCPECRTSYQRRKEQPGYAETNRERARKGMKEKREHEKRQLAMVRKKRLIPKAR